MHGHDKIRWALAFAFSFGCVAGCVSLTQLAPPVDEPLLAAARASGVADAARLARGREIYLDGCVRCHGLYRIERYSAAEWQQILPEMAREARLSEADEAAVGAYLAAARAHLLSTEPSAR